MAFFSLTVLEPTDVTLPICMPGQRISVAVANPKIKKEEPYSQTVPTWELCSCTQKFIRVCAAKQTGVTFKKGPTVQKYSY